MKFMKDYIKAEDFDKKFDDGEEDIIEYLDLAQMKRPGNERKQVNVYFPLWMVEALEVEAHRLGISYQSLINVWVAERLDRVAEK
jgi:hypothetical protein